MYSKLPKASILNDGIENPYLLTKAQELIYKLAMFPNLAGLSRERGDAAHGNHGGSETFVECVCLEVLEHGPAGSRVIQQGLVRCHEPLFVLDVDEILGIELAGAHKVHGDGAPGRNRWALLLQ